MEDFNLTNNLLNTLSINIDLNLLLNFSTLKLDNKNINVDNLSIRYLNYYDWENEFKGKSVFTTIGKLKTQNNKNYIDICICKEAKIIINDREVIVNKNDLTKEEIIKINNELKNKNELIIEANEKTNEKSVLNENKINNELHSKYSENKIFTFINKKNLNVKQETFLLSFRYFLDKIEKNEEFNIQNFKYWVASIIEIISKYKTHYISNPYGAIRKDITSSPFKVSSIKSEESIQYYKNLLEIDKSEIDYKFHPTLFLGLSKKDFIKEIKEIKIEDLEEIIFQK